jgi:ADP-heptose:LPS heptosyltransferase
LSTDRSLPRALVPVGGRVAILRALPGLGDFLCVTPALRALRSARPDLEVTLIGLERSRPLVARFGHLVDRFLAFPGFPGLPEQPVDVRAIPGFLAEAQARQFDLAIQLHGSGMVSNTITELLGARRTAGHVPASEGRPASETHLPWIEDCSEIRRSLRLMSHLGWPSDDERLEFPIAPDTVPPTLPRDYVVVHPGASVAARRWAGDGFAEVAGALAADGVVVVLTGAPEEIARNRRIAQMLAAPPLDLTGRTSLDELALTLRGARLLLANDTGVAHLADALDIPSVVVFTGSNPARWQPLDASRHRIAPGSVRRVLREARRLLGETVVARAA